MRRSSRNQEQRDAPGRDEDGDFSESLRTCIWQPLGLLTTVKPPALRERHDCPIKSVMIKARLWIARVIGLRRCLPDRVSSPSYVSSAAIVNQRF